MLFYMILYKHKKKKKIEIVISKLEIMTWITILNTFWVCVILCKVSFV